MTALVSKRADQLAVGDRIIHSGAFGRPIEALITDVDFDVSWSVIAVALADGQRWAYMPSDRVLTAAD
jgi:hypothetical protein